jgi:hypothetical protein
MSSDDRCVLPEDLAALLDGRLDARARHEIDVHIDRCPACRELVSAVARATHAAEDSSHRLAPVDPSPLSLAPTLPILRDPDRELAIGDRMDRYVVEGRLGAGAMGVVYAAYDPELDRRIALKVLRGDAAADTPDGAAPLDERLLREAQVMAQLAHPNVVTVHDVGRVGSRVFLAMELVDGETLRQWLRARRSRTEVLATFVAAGRGLAAQHRAGLVHRDFKPENVLVGRDGRVRVTDFGLAHAISEPIAATVVQRRVISAADAWGTVTREFAGTPFYMAPEQYRGEAVDARTDQFSFCVALYAALTGEHPLGPDPVGSLAEAASGRPVPAVRARGEVMPRWLYRVLARGLAMSPSRRFPSMDALLDELARSPLLRRLRRAAVGAVVVMLAVGAMFGYRAVAARLSCQGAPARLAGVWDEARAAAIARAFFASGKTNARQQLALVSRLLGEYAQSWVGMRTEACHAARVRGEQSEAILGLRAQCLEARLHELADLTGRLARADAEMVEHGPGLVQALGTLGVCADEQTLASTSRPEVVPLPAPAVTRDRSGQLVYFIRAPGGALVHGVCVAAAACRETTIADGLAGDPSLVRDGDARLHWLARTRGGALLHGVEDVAGGTRWQIAPLADDLAGDPAAVRDGLGRLAWFARKRDGSLWHGWQDTRDGTWPALELTRGTIGNPAAALDAHGQLSYFVRRADHSLWRGWQDAPGSNRWSEAKQIDNIVGDPVVMLNRNGGLVFVYRRASGALWASHQRRPDDDWSYVKLVDGAAGVPAVVVDGSGRLHVLTRRIDRTLWHGWQAGAMNDRWPGATVAKDVTGDPGATLLDERVTWLVRSQSGEVTAGSSASAMDD